MQIPKSLRRWMNLLTVLFVAMSISAYSGVVFPPVWLVVLIPLTVLFIIVTLNMVIRLIYLDEALLNLRALNCLYQMEMESE